MKPLNQTAKANEGVRRNESPPPPYNLNLDPDNATSPLPPKERRALGREHFFPEGGPEDPPVRDFEKEYDLKVEATSE